MVASIAKAAQYLRMSTDLQRYSLENQSEAIGLYAASRGLTIIETYEDGGRSGLSLDRRPALQALLTDVQSGRADFSTILVYDVSRWGRFQDSDESAHYEYLCKQAGVTVEYCAELFENDGSLTATVIKNIKRAMAGEFSRELSVKTFAGQRRLASHGYHVGAAAGYGLRRMLLDETGKPKFELSYGQRKSLTTERVILVPGPLHEVKTVNRIYDLFLDRKLVEHEIAEKLNREGVMTELGGEWSTRRVTSVLSNEKYIGNAVYNRTSFKLKGKLRRNPEAEWTRKPGAYEAIVSDARFKEAATRLRLLRRPLSNNDLLDQLSALWCKAGHLSVFVLDQSRYVPSAKTYAERFGSFSKALRLIGFHNRENIGRNADLRKRVGAELTAGILRRGGTVRQSGNYHFIVNGEITVGIKIARRKSHGPKVWLFGYASWTKPDIVVGVRAERQQNSIIDYLVLPFLFMPHGSWVTTSEGSNERFKKFSTPTLEPLYVLCGRKPLGEVL